MKIEKVDLDRLFDQQIHTLVVRECPESIIRLLERQRNSVLAFASAIDFKDGRISFLPVIPHGDNTTRMNIKDQVKMIRIGNVQGHTELDPIFIRDANKKEPDYEELVMGPPVRDPYYIFDVEDGNMTLGLDDKGAVKIIKKQNRSGLTAVEAIALSIHTDVLLNHCIAAAGSRYGYQKLIPDVRFFVGKQPKLGCRIDRAKDSRWGTPSCMVSKQK